MCNFFLQVQNHFFASAEAVLGLAAHLLVQTDQGGGELVLLLLHMGAGGEGEVDCLHLQKCKLNTVMIVTLYWSKLFTGWNRAGTKPDPSSAGRIEHSGSCNSASQT